MNRPVLKSTQSDTFCTQDRELLDVVSDVYDGDSDNEDDVTKSRDINWSLVAERLETKRAPAECMKRYNKLTGNRQTEKMAALKGPWTEEEDQKIIELVKINGPKRWSQIAAELPGTCTHGLF